LDPCALEYGNGERAVVKGGGDGVDEGAIGALGFSGYLALKERE